MSQIRLSCLECLKPHRMTSAGLETYGNICRPCFKKKNGKSRPIPKTASSKVKPTKAPLNSPKLVASKKKGKK